MNKRLKLIASVVLVLLLACVYFYWFDDVSAADLRSYIQSFGLAAPLIYIAAFSLLPIVFFPAQVLALTAGLLFGLWDGTLYTLIGALINSLLMFVLTRYLLGNSLGEWLKAKCPYKWRKRFFSADSNSGFWLIFLFRLIPAMPYNLINFLAGLSKIPLSQYLAATAVGIIPGTLVYLNIGDKVLDVSSPAFWLSLLFLATLTAFSLLLAGLCPPDRRHIMHSLPILWQQRQMFAKKNSFVTNSEAVFWPGCVLLNLDKGITESLYCIIKTAEPKLGFCTYCCGKPSKHLASDKAFKRRMEGLNRALGEAGVKRIYTACPNCTKMLTEYSGLTVIPLWQTLNENLPKQYYNCAKGWVLSLHDPCPLRHDAVTQQAVRELLSKMGVDYREFAHNRSQTICCGNYNMFMQTKPAVGKRLLQRRLEEAPTEQITSYCQGCLSAFAKEGRDTVYILELLFGKSRQKSFEQRLQNIAYFRTKSTAW